MIRIENIDCLELLRSLPDNSIDLMLQDPPYGTTQNEWDEAPNLPTMWQEWNRVAKENAAFIFTSAEPFASDLIHSNRKFFKYDLIWDKSQCTGFLNANKMPLRTHENILIFYRQLPTYNPQKVKGKKQLKSTGGKTSNYGKFNYQPHYSEIYHPKSILSQFPQIRVDGGHPTQKPIDLMRYLIRTYSNPGDTVFDGYSGSGTVADACMMEGRNCIASELNKEYYDYSIKRLAERSMKPELFTPMPTFSA